jgi:ABC-type multidrug transport system ATPase subunit
LSHLFIKTLGTNIGKTQNKDRFSLGICPQHDKLWDELTAEQHLLFYARFKGMERSDLSEYVAAALQQFGLDEEATETVGTFSGGMKRRVSVAVSAMANPSVVYLDEPTTGMDPLHRRQVWDMIQQLRSDRIIVLTTHSMEEADSLGDQIAIMASGKLRALGSSIFLKQKFGRGFQIGLISRPEDSPEVERLVEELLPGAETVSAAAGNVAISLGKRLLSRVPDFFRALESGELSKYVNEWSLSNTRLEEVFLRLCAGNTEVNAGGTGDSGTLTFDDLSSLTATEAIDVFNELAWTSEQVKSVGAAGGMSNAQMAVPGFSTDDGNRVLAELADGEVALGHIVIDERTKIARDKTVGTMAKPLIAKAVNDGKGTLSVVLPATGLPAAKLCVEVPDLRKIFIEVPMDGTIGEEIFFTAPPPLAQSTSTSAPGGVQLEGDELFRTQREPPQISTLKQTFALVAKQASLQSRQKKSNCCQCCIFFTLVLFGLFSAPPLTDTTERRSLLYTPVLDGQIGPEQEAGVQAGSAFELEPIMMEGGNMEDTTGWLANVEGFLPNGTTVEVVDGHRRLQGENIEMAAISPTMFMFCMATMLHLPKFVYQLIEEKQQRLYHSMRLQGMSLFAYWLGVYVYDFILYGSFATVFVGLGYSFKVERFMHANAVRYILALLVFGHSQIGMAVFASSIVRSPKLATVLFYLIIVSSCIAAIEINTFIPANWSPFLLMVPTLAYPRSIALILADGGGFAIAASSELARSLWIQALMGTGLFVVGVFLHIVLPNEFGMTESHLVTQFCARLNKTDGPVSLTGDAASRERSHRNHSDPDLLVQRDGAGGSGFTVGGSESSVDPSGAVDPNVSIEESKVKRGEVQPDTCPILINDLGLVYLPGVWTQFVSFMKRLLCGGARRAPKQAVGGVSLSIGSGELFGLLGPNGAGKTSVVNILSGLIVQSEGESHVGSFNTSSEMQLVHTILGVCPQFDTVWAELTVEEHLILYARLKGVSLADQQGLVQSGTFPYRGSHTMLHCHPALSSFSSRLFSRDGTQPHAF